ncbi:MAG: AI-2E family transporter [Thermodesulfobacteriota bacterium]
MARAKRPVSRPRSLEGQLVGPATRAEGTDQAGKPGLRLDMGHAFLFALLFLVLGGCLYVLAPYLGTILLAIILAIVFGPVHRRILRLVGGRQDLAALLSSLGLVLVVVLPLLAVFLSLVHQGVQSANAIQAWIQAGEHEKLLTSPWALQAKAMLEPYLPDLKKIFPILDGNAETGAGALVDLSSRLGKFLLGQTGALVGNLSGFLAKVFLVLFTFYFMVRDEKRIYQRLLHLIPLSASHEEQILARIKTVAGSVLLGTLITAVAQGLAGGLAFLFTGLPALFWGTMMAFASLIPFVGTALIWLPAAGYLLLIGRWWAALFLVVWSVVVVGSIDNFVRPLFMQGSADMSTLVIFFAILGGLHTFGMIGLLYGPLLFGLALVLLYIYEIEMEPFLTHQDRSR